MGMNKLLGLLEMTVQTNMIGVILQEKMKELKGDK